MIHLSIATCSFPDMVKEAQIISIYKKKSYPLLKKELQARQHSPLSLKIFRKSAGRTITGILRKHF